MKKKTVLNQWDSVTKKWWVSEMEPDFEKYLD